MSSGSSKRLCLWNGLFLLQEQAQLNMAILTDGFTAFMSIDKSHDGAQGHVWVILDALQVADGILDMLCKDSASGSRSGAGDHWSHGTSKG
jgi:hypothetical protein